MMVTLVPFMSYLAPRDSDNYPVRDQNQFTRIADKKTRCWMKRDEHNPWTYMDPHHDLDITIKVMAVTLSVS